MNNPPPGKEVVIGLNAAIVTASEERPEVLTVDGIGEEREGLPFGAFDPHRHRTMELGLRSLVREQAGLDLGYVEQLYTFGDRARHGAARAQEGRHVVSIGYLAITRPTSAAPAPARYRWRDWYGFFPWEDWREGRPPLLDDALLPALARWVKQEARHGRENARGRQGLALGERLRVYFGLGEVAWDEERVLERYELLYQAGLVREALLDGRGVGAARDSEACADWSGVSMRYDHRRILATAMSRLRGKLKYRPVVFESMPEVFTLYELQRTVEAISGHRLHKQNFRRLVDRGGLVENTGKKDTGAGGRPAALMRFRREALYERPAPGRRRGRQALSR